MIFPFRSLIFRRLSLPSPSFVPTFFLSVVAVFIVNTTAVLAAQQAAGGNSRPVLQLPTPAQAAEESNLEAATQAAEARVTEAQRELPKLQAEWEPKFLEQMGRHLKFLK